MTGRRPCRLCQRRVRWHLCGPGKVRRYEPGARGIAMGFITRKRDFLAATDIASALSDVVRCPLKGRWGLASALNWATGRAGVEKFDAEPEGDP